LTVLDESAQAADGAKGRRTGHIFCLQLGSKTLRAGNDDDAESGHAFYDIFAMADLQSLAVKEAEVEAAKPQNGKRLRVVHTTNQLAKLPKSFAGTSKQEALCLEYLRGVGPAFCELYRHRRPLFTHPKNECNVHKFVCTTVRRCFRCLHGQPANYSLLLLLNLQSSKPCSLSI
jgi:hypothetical protein